MGLEGVTVVRMVKVSVRRLVEFLLRSGSIDSSRAGDLDAAQLGSEVHRRLQAMAEGPYRAEVSLARSFYFPQGALVPAALRMDVPPAAVEGSDPTGWFLRVEGRADGIMDQPSGVTIDEIKGTYADVAELEGPVPVHAAQARCYAYLYLRERQAATGDAMLRRADPVTVRMTYVGLETGEIRRFEQAMWFQELEGWFLELLAGYHRWLGPHMEHVRLRDASLRELAFPYPWRAGQRELVGRVGDTIREGGRLYLQAPTGSGKTVGCLWPALRCMGEGQVRRVVYLTAKTIARQAACDCLDLLNQGGARVVVVVLTARDKICPLRQDAGAATVRAAGHVTPCNPVECPYARGHFDRINAATHELLSAGESGVILDRMAVLAAAERCDVCPYELQLELADWADLVVCDYNYVFRPTSELRCLGGEPGQAVLLVDEAHNLVDRARELYSADLTGKVFAEAARVLAREGGSHSGGPEAERLALALGRVAAYLGCGAVGSPLQLPTGEKAIRTVVDGGDHEPSYRVVQAFGKLPAMLEDLLPMMESYRAQVPAAEQVRQPYQLVSALSLQIAGFQAALERAENNDKYVLYREDLGTAGQHVKVFCYDPSGDVEERLAAVRAAVLFSATMIPRDYYRQLLAARACDASYQAISSFDRSRQLVLVGADVRMRYSKRDQVQYQRVARYVRELLDAKPGNYLVFLPSYAVLREVQRALTTVLPPHTQVLSQRAGMGEGEREEFLAALRSKQASGARGLPGRTSLPTRRVLAIPAHSLVGLCVLGGFFAESVDLQGDALVGVVVVGVGLPRASADREIVRKGFDESGRNGFAYAYTYPGMTKVLQAAGRLIRTEKDTGVVLLLDERFATDEYRELYPRNWGTPRAVTSDTVGSELAHFWSGA